jgi:hypothetical protein
MNNKPKETPAKLPYRSPRLTVFGSVRQLTGHTSNNVLRGDGGRGSLRKTG